MGVQADIVKGNASFVHRVTCCDGFVEMYVLIVASLSSVHSMSRWVLRGVDACCQLRLLHHMP